MRNYQQKTQLGLFLVAAQQFGIRVIVKYGTDRDTDRDVGQEERLARVICNRLVFKVKVTRKKKQAD